MNPYPLQLEISGPIAPCLRLARRGRQVWARPDTMPNPVSYVAPTFSAAKGIIYREFPDGVTEGNEGNKAQSRCALALGTIPSFGLAADFSLPFVIFVHFCECNFGVHVEPNPRWKSVNVRPTRCEVCAPVQFHRYAFNYGGPHGEGPDGLNAGLGGFSSLV